MRHVIPKIALESIKEAFSRTDPAGRQIPPSKPVLDVIAYLVGGWLQAEDDGITLTNYRLALAEGKLAQDKNRNYEPEQFLAELTEFVRFNELPRRLGEPRKVRLKLSAEQQEAVTRLFQNPTPDKLVLTNGKTATSKNLKAEVKTALNHARDYDTGKVQELRRIVEYHNHLHPQVFTRRIQKNLRRVQDWINELDDPHQRARLNVYITNLRAYPKTYLRPSERSARLAPVGPVTWTSLPSNLRRLLLPNALELDLSNCHLAVAARLWDCPKLYNVLSNGKIWDYCHAELGIPRDYKPAVKKFTYSLAYGSKNPVRHFNAEAKRLGLEPKGHAERLANSDIFMELANRRDARLEALKQKTSLETVLGYSIPLDRTKSGLRSALSLEIQAYEALLISEIYRHAKNDKRYTILVYSFDGVTLEVMKPHRPEPVIEELQEAIKALANRLQIPTGLEVTYP